MPPHPKTASTSTMPFIMLTIRSAVAVMMGMRAFRTVCLQRTSRPGSPFARAVRTKSEPMTSRTDDLVSLSWTTRR